ncbi:glycerol-3-phosphate phosphatase-like [Hydractinia symbiolongicarpus]|uniref:glycerol-3-phosphate phosphatase-like n=1 Tax=Hydractinia symbiolongicarpus TaxID=13093 RepID=UPI00254E10D8|nr:glycerol-3-phosphate phosphatase-like [Hydractinia symbiolongicarpus]
MVPNMAVYKISKSVAKNLMNTVETFFFDCDGVLWNSYGPIPGAIKTIKTLKLMNKKVFFVTNNSSFSRKDYLKKFLKYEIAIEENEILSTAFLAATYVKNILKLRKVYMIGNVGMATEFENAGIEFIGFGPQLPENDQTKHYCLNYDVTVQDDVEAVVVGFDPHFNLNKISQAMQYLAKGLPFIATNTDNRFPVGNGVFTPGTGCIVSAVQTAAQREPNVLGKPNSLLFDVAKSLCDINPSKTVMFGDRLETDILFGKKCGFQTVCVLSGVTNESQLEAMLSNKDTDLYPQFIADSLQDFADALED